jgi:uncharacterized peroxidase-related enzyme
MPRIKVIPHEEATGRLKEIYDDIVQSRGKLAEVHKIQSLHPESIVKHMDLYMEIMYSKSSLTRAEREMIAVVVSRANECTYCQKHHAEALLNYWKDEEKVNQLRSDYRQVDLTERELALCVYAETVTLHPGKGVEADPTRHLRLSLITDEGILDATLVIAYFNFVNRIVLPLQVELENDAGKGYKY